MDDEEGYLTGGAHLETVMHTEAYRARPDVGAVIHTHPLHSIALGATDQGLALLSHDGLLFPNGVPVFDGTAGLVTSPAHARAVAQALGSGRAVLLRNHGILVVGEDIPLAVLAAITTERPSARAASWRVTSTAGGWRRSRAWLALLSIRSPWRPSCAMRPSSAASAALE